MLLVAMLTLQSASYCRPTIINIAGPIEHLLAGVGSGHKPLGGHDAMLGAKKLDWATVHQQSLVKRRQIIRMCCVDVVAQLVSTHWTSEHVLSTASGLLARFMLPH